MKKKIGVILRPGISDEGYNTQILYDSIKDAVTSANALVIGVPIYQNLDDTYSLISLCDGVILQGGDEPTDLDIEIAKYLYDNNIPTLGICLGMQTMAIALNGELDDFHNQNHYQKGIDYVHSIEINPSSLLYEIVGENKIKVNSRHKSYVKSTNLTISAYSEDGFIEALEDYSKTFFIGVQWHPESMISYDIYANKLFAALIKYSGGKSNDDK